MYRPTVAEVHLNHLTHNYQLFQSFVGSKFFCAMVKANAYGHGEVPITRHLESLGCQYAGVALVEEGIQLRQGGIKLNILTFSTYTESSLKACAEYNLTPVLSQLSDLKVWAQLAKKSAQPLNFHLELNTGMNRLGVSTADVTAVKNFLEDHSEIFVAGIFTHLSHGEDFGDPQGQSVKQVRQLHDTAKEFSKLCKQIHVYASSSLIGAMREAHGTNEQTSADGARVGLSLYGVQHTIQKPYDLPLKPVLRIKTAVVALNSLKAGQTVSYSGTWRASKDSLIAVLPIGYADGFNRFFSNCGEVLIHGQRAPVVGNVCMDYVMIDVTHINAKKPVGLGDEVVLLGAQNNQILTAEYLAQKINSVSYTLLTGFSNRIPREYFNS